MDRSGHAQKRIAAALQWGRQTLRFAYFEQWEWKVGLA
jgi:hypothetical protein